MEPDCAKLFEYDEKEAIGQPLSIVLPEENKHLHVAGIKRVSSGGEMHVIGKTVELAGVHKEGHVFPIELSLSTWKNAGKRFYSGIIRDITKRKKAEQEILDSRAELATKAQMLKEWDDLGIIRLVQIRIGINSGFATAGNFGSEDRLEYTIVGGNVNLASRLESAASPDNILISHSTHSLGKDEVVCVERDEVATKGLDYPVRTDEVVNVIADINPRKTAYIRLWKVSI